MLGLALASGICHMCKAAQDGKVGTGQQQKYLSFSHDYIMHFDLSFVLKISREDELLTFCSADSKDTHLKVWVIEAIHDIPSKHLEFASLKENRMEEA